eukprot:4554639-Amphidinium_carterae.1
MNIRSQSMALLSTTSMITKLMALQSSKSQQLWVLKGFLLQHKFPAELRDRVLRCGGVQDSNSARSAHDRHTAGKELMS